MVHVCIVLHDKFGDYSKYAAVAICSVFERTSEKVCIHILHDETINEYVKDKFFSLAAKYNQTIKFYLIDTQVFLNLEGMTRSFTIGTLYRFKIPEVISDEVKKIIYLDTDTIVNLDICNLWNIDLQECVCAACLDPGIKSLANSGKIIAEGLVDVNRYFNAGVMVFNLALLRSEYDLCKEGVQFLSTHAGCTLADQDAMNYLFKDRVLFLDSRYNMFSRFSRGQKRKLEECIYHISGDNILLDKPECFDRLFLYYLELSAWDNNILFFAKKLLASRVFKLLYEASVKDCAMKIVFWGAGSKYTKDVLSAIPAIAGRVYLVDGDIKLHGKKMYNMLVQKTDIVQRNDNHTMIVVISKRRYYEIVDILEYRGFRENENIFNGVDLLLQCNRL